MTTPLAGSPVEQTGPAVVESLQLGAGVVGVVVAVVLDQSLRQPLELVHGVLTAVHLLLQLLQHGSHSLNTSVTKETGGGGGGGWGEGDRVERRK